MTYSSWWCPCGLDLKRISSLGCQPDANHMPTTCQSNRSGIYINGSCFTKRVYISCFWHVNIHQFGAVCISDKCGFLYVGPIFSVFERYWKLQGKAAAALGAPSFVVTYALYALWWACLQAGQQKPSLSCGFLAV
jgi:hypothetical protein